MLFPNRTRVPRALRWLPLLVLGAAAGSAQPDPLALALDPIDDVVTFERLGGDEALAEAFEAGAKPVHFLVVGASDAPETHLRALATLAASDDPDRSVWAAESGRRIAETLRADGLAAREARVDRSAIHAWRALVNAP
ncbi:MAG: hypothetical protein AAF938_30505, partial [Myxococcota bacterium]